MKELIDVTHTVKASAAPSEGARYMLDPATNERFWVEQGTVPAEVPNPVIFDSIVEGAVEEYLMGKEPETPPEMPTEPEPAPEPEVPRKTKKLHHG